MKQFNAKQFSMLNLLAMLTVSAFLVAAAVNNPSEAKWFALHAMQFLPVLPVIIAFTWLSKRRRITFVVVSLAALFGFNIVTHSEPQWIAPPTFFQLFWFDLSTVTGLAIVFALFFGVFELIIPNPNKRDSTISKTVG